MQSKAADGLLVSERLSYLSNDRVKEGADDSYVDIKTPNDLEDGALRQGGAPVYTSPDVLAKAQNWSRYTAHLTASFLGSTMKKYVTGTVMKAGMVNMMKKLSKPMSQSKVPLYLSELRHSPMMSVVVMDVMVRVP
ncbi:Aste57867_3998 [Aphanomyces stellatus]|uniref:Aste57867_3998 protein n=1 Tax=Aphanomyces stellatus TaxID=120398 RepID=A0A485KAQ7_9STRA|nr:hypothetical protein As57867_003987 [Aphanomyces stellatus]VFT81133.1 Aste57867_3998 [Aphanomyces stellatus]